MSGCGVTYGYQLAVDRFLICVHALSHVTTLGTQSRVFFTSTAAPYLYRVPTIPAVLRRLTYRHICCSAM